MTFGLNETGLNETACSYDSNQSVEYYKSTV